MLLRFSLYTYVCNFFIRSGTPQFSGPATGSEEDNLAYIRRLFEESAKGKENINGRGPPHGQTTPSKRPLLSEKNGSPDKTPISGYV